MLSGTAQLWIGGCRGIIPSPVTAMLSCLIGTANVAFQSTIIPEGKGKAPSVPGSEAAAGGDSGFGLGGRRAANDDLNSRLVGDHEVQGFWQRKPNMESLAASTHFQGGKLAQIRIYRSILGKRPVQGRSLAFRANLRIRGSYDESPPPESVAVQQFLDPGCAKRLSRKWAVCTNCMHPRMPRGRILDCFNDSKNQHSIREEKMDKIYPASTLLAVILAIVTAFVSVPMSAAALLILGGIGALKNSPEVRLRVYAAAIVLILGAKSLAAIPVAGDPLAAIFSALATALVGASVVGVTLGIFHVIKLGLMK
ncbi:MAG TPA: hypothetical protein VNW15_16260 [Rhizomicrobium sp.]|nr:hypothetical protein [Rhizomicrobium sp.]